MVAKISPQINTLIEAHSDQAYASAYRLTGNHTDACDLVQEAFLRALEKSDLYDPAFDFGGWLYRVLYRVYLNGRRSRTRRNEIPLEEISNESTGIDTWKAAPGESPDIALEHKEMRSNIAEALDRLSDEMRACIVLVDIEGHNYEQAADILNWPVGSVAGRLFRARRMLREILQQRGQ